MTRTFQIFWHMETARRIADIGLYIEQLAPTDPLFPVGIVRDSGALNISLLVSCSARAMVANGALPSSQLERYAKLYAEVKDASTAVKNIVLTPADLTNLDIIRQRIADAGIVIKPAGRHQQPNRKPAMMFAIFYAYDYVAAKQIQPAPKEG